MITENPKPANLLPCLLYVDNEEESCVSFRAIFRRDYPLYTTTEPLSVSALIEQKGIDVILTDYTMPKVLGSVLLQFVKKQYPQVARVLVTGSVDQTLREQILGEGLVEAWITKPWSKVEMDKIIKDVFYIRRK